MVRGEGQKMGVWDSEKGERNRDPETGYRVQKRPGGRRGGPRDRGNDPKTREGTERLKERETQRPG